MNMTLNARLDEPNLAVATSRLVKRYETREALSGVELTVPEGSAYVLVGPNGAGKTTMLKLLVDLIRPSSGSALVFDRSTTREGAEIRAGIGYVPEQHDVGYRSLRVRQVLEHHRAYYPRWDREYADELCRLLEIPLDETLGSQSKGMARRVQLVQVLAHRPRLLLLDEPTDGLDPLARDRIVGLLARHMADSPTTLLISTHLVHEVEGLADCVGVLNRGRLVAQVRRGDLQERLRRYLLETPAGWSGPPSIAAQTLKQEGSGRQFAWTVWGEPDRVVSALQGSGATVRDAETLTLDRAARVLLSMEEPC